MVFLHINSFLNSEVVKVPFGEPQLDSVLIFKCSISSKYLLIVNSLIMPIEPFMISNTEI